MIIRNILDRDIQTILDLNEKSVKVLSPLNDGKLRGLIEMSELSVVVERENEVAGFLLALANDAEYESINYQWFNDNYDRFLYVDRIVVSDRFRGKGIASMLYEYVIERATEKSVRSVLAEIDVMPPNEPSLLFHKKYGFVELELLKHNDSKIVSLQELKVTP